MAARIDAPTIYSTTESVVTLRSGETPSLQSGNSVCISTPLTAAEKKVCFVSIKESPLWTVYTQQQRLLGINSSSTRPLNAPAADSKYHLTIVVAESFMRASSTSLAGVAAAAPPPSRAASLPSAVDTHSHIIRVWKVQAKSVAGSKVLAATASVARCMHALLLALSRRWWHSTAASAFDTRLRACDVFMTAAEAAAAATPSGALHLRKALVLTAVQMPPTCLRATAKATRTLPLQAAVSQLTATMSDENGLVCMPLDKQWCLQSQLLHPEDIPTTLKKSTKRWDMLSNTSKDDVFPDTPNYKSRYDGRSSNNRSQTNGLLRFLLLLLLLLLVRQSITYNSELLLQQGTPAVQNSPSSASVAPIVPLLVLSNALPLPRRGRLYHSNNATLLAPPLTYAGPRRAAACVRDPSSAVAPLLHSSSLLDRDPQLRNSSCSYTAERHGSSTALGFISSAGALRLGSTRHAAAAIAQQHEQLQQHASAASPVSSGSPLNGREKNHRGGNILNIEHPSVHMPAVGAASTSVFSSVGRSSSSYSAASNAQKLRKEGVRTTFSNDSASNLFSPVAETGRPRVVSATAAAASGDKSDGGKLMGGVKEVIMPALSSTMKEGRIVSWTKQVGDRVQVGDVVMVVESDKADMDVEALDDGYMAYHALPEGESAPVGSTVALIAENVEDLPYIEQHGVGLLSSDKDSAASTDGEGDVETAAATSGATTAATTADFTAGRAQKALVSELILPALGPSARDGHIATWKKKEGDIVRQGEVIFVVESDKADMDVEAPHDGVLARILVDPGVRVPVGTSVGLLARDTTAAAEAAAAALYQQRTRVSGVGHMPEGTREVFLRLESPATAVSARVVKWLRRVGDFVKTGDKLVVVETDAGDGNPLEIRSADDGYLAAMRVQEQQHAAAGETLALLVAAAQDVALVQQLLQQQRFSKTAARGETGAAVEYYSSFPDKKEVAESLATWTFPSVDQDVTAQLPPGLTPEDLEREFLRRIQQRLPPEIIAKLRGPQGAAYLKRLSLRPPPPHTLRDTTAPPQPAEDFA